MKKNFLIAMAAFAILLASCAKNEIIEGTQNSDNAIRFSISASKQTRAGVVDNINVKDKPMGLFAYYTGQSDWATVGSSTGPNFMYDQKVEYSGSVWTYNPIKYWPNTKNDKITFFAYWPQETGITAISTSYDNTTQGEPSISFTQNISAVKMVDFVVAAKADQIKQNENVILPFKHALTRLNFSARVDRNLQADDATKGVTSLFIKSLKVLGTEDSGGSGVNANSKFYANANYKLAIADNGEWNYVNSTKVSAAMDATSILNTRSSFSGSYNSTSVAIDRTGVATRLLKANEYLFLIPPGGKTGITSPADIRIQVQYDVVTLDASLAKGYTKTTSTITIPLPDGSLAEGKAYNIMLTFGTALLTDVKVAADLSEWDNEADKEVFTLQRLQDILNNAATEIGQDVSVNVAEKISGNSVVTIPDAVMKANTPSINMFFTNIDAGVKLTITDATPNVENNNYDGNINITVPSGTNATDIEIKTNKAHVTVHGSFGEIISSTSPSTIVVAEGAIITNLIVVAGNVDVYGTVTNISRHADNKDSQTVLRTFNSGSITNSISDPNIVDFLTQPVANCYMIDTERTDMLNFIISLSMAQEGWSVIDNCENGKLAEFNDFVAADNWEVITLWKTWAGNKNIYGEQIKNKAGESYVKLKFDAGIFNGNNAVIALRDKSTEKIYWSWHLWFTDYNPSTTEGTAQNGQVHQYYGDAFTNTNGIYKSKFMMDRNLGATVINVNGDINPATITKLNAPKYYGLYYQFGRKDPFVGSADGSTNNFVAIYDANGSKIEDNKKQTGKKSLSFGITSPLDFITSSEFDWTNLNDTDLSNKDLWYATQNKKSPFDPCPAGWRIPIGGKSANDNPWAGFGTLGTSEVNSGQNSNFIVANTENSANFGRLYVSQTSTPTVKAWYPATGMRSSTGGILGYVSENAYYWSSQPVNAFTGYTLYYHSGNVYPWNGNYRACGFPIRPIQE